MVEKEEFFDGVVERLFVFVSNYICSLFFLDILYLFGLWF